MSIWNFKEIRKQFDDKVTIITKNEGETRVDELKIADYKIFLKREDLNPTGSWKDRGTAFKMTELLSHGKFEAVISSSGNAAISFLNYALLINNFKMHIVISPNTNFIKLEKIKILINNSNHRLYITENTRKKAVEISAQLKIPNLRASIDENIIKGYWSLGFEISKLIKQNDNNENTALFIPVSSGTTLIGVIQGLFSILEQEYLMPKVFICQTQSVHPLLEKDSSILNTKIERSLADSIFDTILLRKPQLNKIINQTNGSVLIITNEELTKAKNLVQNTIAHDLSYTSLLSIAGFLRVKGKFNKNICIASGL